jgi:hypothetical protein
MLICRSRPQHLRLLHVTLVLVFKGEFGWVSDAIDEELAIQMVGIFD